MTAVNITYLINDAQRWSYQRGPAVGNSGTYVGTQTMKALILLV